MEKCRFCQADLAEKDTVCPVCGKDNAQEQELPEPTVALFAEEETAVQEQPEAQAQPDDQEPAEQEPADQEPAEQPKAKSEATPTKIALMISAIVVVAAIIVGLLVAGFGGEQPAAPELTDTVPTEQPLEEVQPVTEGTIPPDGNPDDVTCKGSYTAADAEVIAAADTVVATVEGRELTNAQLQVYYWLDVQGFLTNYYSTAASFGLNHMLPLDTQICGLEPEKTWQQFFLQSALSSWHNYQSLSIEADANGYELPQEDREYLDGLAQTLENQAVQMGFADAKEMLAYNVGNCAQLEDYIHFMELYYKGFGYFNELYQQIQPTDEEVEAYYQTHAEEYAEMGLTQDLRYVDARHILVTPEGGTVDETGMRMTYTDEEWAACEAQAQAILDQWLAGEATEDTFAALANEKSTDPGSNTNGGLYQNIYEGQMVAPFEDWCFDETREYGDYGLVKTDYGYHIMFFVKRTPVWISYATSDIITERSNGMVDDIAVKYPMEVSYGDILLGYLDLSN